MRSPIRLELPFFNFEVITSLLRLMATANCLLGAHSPQHRPCITTSHQPGATPPPARAGPAAQCARLPPRGALGGETADVELAEDDAAVRERHVACRGALQAVAQLHLPAGGGTATSAIDAVTAGRGWPAVPVWSGAGAGAGSAEACGYPYHLRVIQFARVPNTAHCFAPPRVGDSVTRCAAISFISR